VAAECRRGAAAGLVAFARGSHRRLGSNDGAEWRPYGAPSRAGSGDSGVVAPISARLPSSRQFRSAARFIEGGSRRGAVAAPPDAPTFQVAGVVALVEATAIGTLAASPLE
jgi:hypothetical protein